MAETVKARAAARRSETARIFERWRWWKLLKSGKGARGAGSECEVC